MTLQKVINIDSLTPLLIRSEDRHIACRPSVHSEIFKLDILLGSSHPFQVQPQRDVVNHNPVNPETSDSIP